MRINGGPWEGNDTVELWDHQRGLVLVDRPEDRVWIYDVVETPDGRQLDVRESEGRLLDDDKRMALGSDPRWMVRVIDKGEISAQEVGL